MDIFDALIKNEISYSQSVFNHRQVMRFLGRKRKTWAIPKLIFLFQDCQIIAKQIFHIGVIDSASAEMAVNEWA